jgi:hypothetical protein
MISLGGFSDCEHWPILDLLIPALSPKLALQLEMERAVSRKH